MNSNDFPQFAEAFSVSQELQAGGKVLSNAAMFSAFKALSNYPLELVTAAIDKHIQTARFAVTVADIREMLETGNARLSAAESWAIMPKTEAESGCVTIEMLGAWEVCAELYASNQTFAAEKAFLAAYERLAKEADLQNQPVVWQITRGTDANHFVFTVKEATRLNRISTQKTQLLLANLSKNENCGVAGLLTGNIDTNFARRNADRCRVILKELEALENEQNAERERIEARRAQIIAQAEKAL